MASQWADGLGPLKAGRSVRRSSLWAKDLVGKNRNIVNLKLCLFDWSGSSFRGK